ncbi:MAG TPA: glycosyltransferase, partial [Acidobacteriota bacterium]|nr:glycosyltransferase [Acidobacteriota bacterium]
EIKKYDGKKDIDILFVGRLHFQKNVFLLLNSIVALREKQPDITCTIIGDGPELKKIEKFIQQHSLSKNITLKKNTKDHDELYRYYQRAKIFAFPSLLEGFAIVSLEAMACGLPIVTIDAPQNHAKETIGSGALYASNTISDFSQKIQILLNDKKMYQRMKNENLKRAQSYSWTKATRLLERLYSSRI